MSLTEEFLSGMASHLKQFKENIHSSLQSPQADFTTPFRRIDFIPAIEEAIGRTLPDLTGPNAEDEVRRLFHDLSLPLPDLPTLPRLMDKLSSTYIEPQCHDPTFIVNPPECLSPLSKSFKHPSCNQRVAARCELFIDGREYINAYEEENSPFEQRRKFREQRVYNKDTNEWGEVDENYLQALEWGLPPTGGWGCGVDRLCMLFTNSKRISDVLPFGNLRAVTRRSDAADETTG
jgi:lysyl-tRNA synthetase class 2